MRARRFLLRIAKRLLETTVAGAMLLSPICPARANAQEADVLRHSYELRYVEPDAIANRVQRLLSEVIGPTEVYVDRRSGRLVIEGSPEAQKVAAQLLKTLDRAPEDAERADGEEDTVIRGYRVSAEQLEAMTARVRRRFGRDAVAIGADARTRQVVVNATPAVQQLVAKFLQTAESDEPVAQRKPARLPAAEPAASAGSHQLRNLTADQFIQSLKRIWGDLIIFSKTPEDGISTAKIPAGNGLPVMVQIDHKRERVAAVGNQEARKSLDRFLAALDQPLDDPEQELKAVPLNRADRGQVQRAVTALLVSGAGAKDEVTATVPLRGNRKARPTTERLAARTNRAEAQDQGQDPNERRNPDEPEQPNENQPGGPNIVAVDPDAGLIGEVRIEFIEALNLYIIRGKRADVERVVQLIEQIEQFAKTVKPKVEIRELKNVAATPLADLLNQINNSVLSQRQGTVSITSLVKPNALLLIGQEDNVNVVLELIEKLDQPTLPNALWKVFPLKHATSSEVEATVRNLFSGITTAPGQAGAGGAGGGPGGGGGFGGGGLGGAGQQQPIGLRPRITVIGDARSNSVVVQASARDLEEVAALIERLDVEGSQVKNELRVFKLSSTLAQELAPVLQEAIRGQTGQQRTGAAGQQGFPGGGQQFGPGGGGGGQFGQGQQGQQQGANQQARQVTSAGLEFVQIDPKTGKKVVASGVASDVIVTADVAINALIVRAPAKSMELIAALIRELDAGPQSTAQIKVFTIVNGDATYLGQTLQQLFGQQITIGRGTGGAFGGANFGALAGFAAAAGQTGAGETNLVPLRFAIDGRSNSIIASGSASDLSVVEVLLLRLDENNVRSRKISVFRLKNAFASDVATAITNFTQSQRTLFQQDQIFNTSVSPWDQLERQVVVVAEPQSNSVIVSSTPNLTEPITTMIEQLDFRPSMVMVQVLIAEVQLSDVYEFGVEMGLQDSLIFDRGKAALASSLPPGTPGFNFNNVGLTNQNARLQETLAGQGISGFGLGRSNAQLGYGGMVLSAANESINLLVRALQDNQRLQVLSRPQVMAIHNRPAQILVGQKVPRISNSTINNLGNTQNTVQDVDVGLILNIIPQINDDGIVTLYLEAQKSAVGPEEQGIVITTGANGVPVRSPRIDTTSAFTTISARDGQTVVFAGLITSSKNAVVRRVPYLSDIPLLGRLFRFDNETQRRTELLIVMTPKIVKYDPDYDWINATESERMNWCLSDVVAVHGDVGLRGGSDLFCKDTLPICYPDIDPTGSQYYSEPGPMGGAEDVPTPVPPVDSGAYYGPQADSSQGPTQSANWRPLDPRAPTPAVRNSSSSSRSSRPRPTVNQAGHQAGSQSSKPRAGSLNRPSYPVAPADYFPDGQGTAQAAEAPGAQPSNYRPVAPTGYR